MDQFAGPGWILAGDALRFVDPIFSSGVDVALHSAKYAHEAITESWRTGDELAAFDAFQSRVTDGVDIWYDLIEAFYRLQNILSWFAVRRKWKAVLTGALQGNPYDPETQQRSRILLDAMNETYERVMADPNNLLRPWSFDDILRKSAEYNADEEEVGFRFLPCTTCGGRVDMDVERAILVCTKCGTEFPMISTPDRR